ncbi:MAG: ROK family protein, partial [Clostridium paraputrificum]
MEIRETKDLRSLNKIKIIESILLKKQISRADLSTLTGLNKATVSIIVKDLLDLNLIQESTIGDSTGGRKPIMLAIKDDIGYMIAIDLNVNTIDVIVTDLSCKILSSYNILIKNKSFEDAFNDLCALLERIISSIPKCQYNLIGISISVRGVIDLDEVIRFIPELGWRDIDIKSKLVEKFNVPVYIENDGNLSAMAEHELLPNQKDLIVVTIDDDITSGIIANGNLVKGYLG